MTLRELYDTIGGDYRDTRERMMGETLMRKYMNRFPEDDTFRKMCRAYEAGNYEDAFEEAHVLKGLFLSLGLGRLTEEVNGLVEALREGWTPEAPAYYGLVKDDYEILMSAIELLD